MKITAITTHVINMPLKLDGDVRLDPGPTGCCVAIGSKNKKR